MDTQNIYPEQQPQSPAGFQQPMNPQPRGRRAKREPKPESRARKFWRVVFGSCVGFILANAILIVLGIYFLFSLVSSINFSIPKNSILL